MNKARGPSHLALSLVDLMEHDSYSYAQQITTQRPCPMLPPKLKKILLIIIGLISTSPSFADHPTDYDSAVVHSALHQGSAAPSQLTTIQGTKVRMVTFTTYAGYKPSDTSLGANIWTVVESDIKKLCTVYARRNKNSLTPHQLSVWIAQLLGLPETHADQRLFVVLETPAIQAYYGYYPNHTGIFRPCTDPRIGKHRDGTPACPKQMNPDDNYISSEYKTWFINNSISSYITENGAPWTEYGYTYNWNPSASNAYGIAEFVVLKSTPVTVLANPDDSATAYVTPAQYCGLS